MKLFKLLRGRSIRARMLLMACCALLVAPAYAQLVYPERPVRIISGFAAGGSLDLVARLIAEQLTQRLGQAFVVEMKAGAGGAIAAAEVAKSKPDGYTLLMGYDGTLAIGPNLTTKSAFDPVNDFEPISKLVDAPVMIAANPAVPVRTMAELIAVSKSKPALLSYGSAGLGTVPHLTGELLRLRAGVDWVHIPYKGAAAGVTDVVSGATPMMIGTIGPLLPFLRSGKVVGIAIASSTRFAAVPDVPTFRESGVTCCDVLPWYALLAPAGTPRAVVDKLNGEVVAILRKPEIVERLALLGLQASPSTPQQLANTIKSDLARWKEVIRDAKIPMNNP